MRRFRERVLGWGRVFIVILLAAAQAHSPYLVRLAASVYQVLPVGGYGATADLYAYADLLRVGRRNSSARVRRPLNLNCRRNGHLLARSAGGRDPGRGN
jgi:hypothetical protein